MKKKFAQIVYFLATVALLSDAALTVDWTSDSTVVIGTNFTLTIGIDASGNFSLVSAEGIPGTITFTAAGTVAVPSLYGKSFSLNFLSVNGQNFESQSAANGSRIGMTGSNQWRFDLPGEVVRITADLSGVSSNEILQLQSVQVLNPNPATNFVIGLRNSSGAEMLSATNPPGNATINLSDIAPVLTGGAIDFFEYRAASGSAGGWGSLVFEFQSTQTYAGKIQPANIFSSGCVLQRDRTVAVWGTCEPDETITLAVKSQSKSVVADSNGVWRVELDPEPAGGPYTMTVSGANSQPVSLAVYFGDVWILTGQSNMFQPLGGQVANFPNDYPVVPNASDNFDNMRLAIVAIATDSNAPLADVTMDLPWSRWQSNNLSDMSAVGYFFARFLNEQMDTNGLADVPLGFIKVCKGGTSIEEWISAEEINAVKAGNPGLIVAADASGYYNGMIAPIQDYAIKGALWYQGEGNSTPIDRISQYPLLKRTLVESWRAQWSNPELPLYFVQLAPYRSAAAFPSDELWPWMRESQRACLAITNTAMACIVDSGLQGNIHPPFKDRVGERLARIALNKTYGLPFICRGPTVRDVQISGSDITITFDDVGGELETRAVDSQSDAEEIATNLPPVSISASELGGFALCGTNRTFYWATQAEIISSNQVRISNAADVPVPVAIRYAWQDYPRCNLFNSEGLPAEPFRTDAYEYGSASGADSTPLTTGISNRVAHAAQSMLEVDCASVFSDIEDSVDALSFSVSGISNSNVVASAVVSNRVLTITFSGTAGTSVVTIAAQDSSNNAVETSFTVTVETSAYKVWRHEFFTEDQLGSIGAEAGLWGDLADPDADGLSNLLEYALSLSPLESNQITRSVEIVLEDGAVKARFLRSKKAAADSSMAVGIQTSGSLTGSDEWVARNTGDVLHKDLGDAELRDVVLSPAQSGEQILFVRLYVSRVE